MTFGSGFGASFATNDTYASGPADGNYSSTSGGLSVPNFNHNAVVVGVIIILAMVLLITGVVGLRAAGEVVI